MPGPPVAVAVVSWNTRDLLDACLASLAAEAQAGRARVIVVDNASSDGSAAMVRDRHPWAEVLEPGENLGFGRAVNHAAAHAADTAWIVAANADVEFEPGSLAALVAAAEADPDAGAVAPRLLRPDGKTEHSVHPFPTLGFTVALNLGLRRALGDRWCLEGLWDPERPRRIPWAHGACLLIRRAAWNSVGGFAESQFMYAEDLDLGWRLAQARWGFCYAPDARVRHVGAAATSQAYGEAIEERWQEATYRWMLCRRGRRVTRTVAAVNVAGAAARAALLAVPARVRPEEIGWRRARWQRWARTHAVGLRVSP